MNETKSPFLTRPEVSAYLRVSKPTLSRWAKTGQLVPLKIGRNVRYERSAIERMVEKGREAGPGALAAV
jgi:excisionase family DNA binding protein